MRRVADLWGTNKHTNIYIATLPGEGREKEAERIFVEIMSKNFPNVMKNINLHI